jgi:hypothetical protein
MSEQAATTPSAPMTEAGASPVVQEQSGNLAQTTKKEAQATKAEPAKPSSSAPELFEVKIDGKVVRMTRDELIQNASLGHAADRRFKEAAQLRKQAESVIGKLRDPKQVISALQDPALGLTKDQIREQFEEWYAAEFIEPEKLSPTERELKEAKARLEKYAEQEKKLAEQKENDEQEAMTAKAREELQSQIIDALETSGLPKTNFTIRRLAYWIQRNNANGFDAPTDVLVSQVRNEFNSTIRDMVEASDGEVLIKLLGDSIIQKIRKHDLDQLKKMRGGSQPAQPQAPEEKTDKHGRPPTYSDVNKRIRELQRNGW